MAERLSIRGFVEFLEQQHKEGAGYIMASYGQNPRTGYLDLSVTKEKSAWQPTGWYYTQYSGKQREQALKWRKQCKRVFDCQGLSEGYYEIMTGTCVNTKARYNYADWCGSKGKGMIPAERRVPGAAVFWGDSASKIHHVGYLVRPVKDGHPDGDWYIIEARGVMYGVVKTRLYERKPNFWGWMTKYYDYADSGSVPVEPNAPLMGWRILRNGDDGSDVRQMQEALVRLGYDLGRWGADGDFGDATEMAVKEFQADHGLEIDGECGPLTFAAIDAALVALEHPVDNPREVVIEGGNCYVRSAPNTSGKILGVAHRGDRLRFDGVIDEETRWLLVQYKGANGWVSGKYGRLVDA